jgi:transcriptional regulator with XRE-family HTH domain
LDAITDDTVGRNVRRARRFAGLTLDELAGRIGKSKGWLSLVENGKLRLEKRQDIAAIADVLAVSADTLLGQPTPEITPGGQAYNLKSLRAVLLDASIDDPPDMAARPVPQLGQAVTDIDAALRVADYAAMHRDLPGLLGELQVHVITSKGQDRDEALRLLILASSSAMIMLRHFGRTDLAWVAADRGRQAAALLGDPAWSAAAAFEVAHARPSVNLPRSLLSTPRLADEFESLAGNDPFRREVYGMLRLSAALACAVQGDHGGAEAHGAEAARVAEPLGDRPEAFELFGPANVGVWRASLAVEAGNAEAALTFADHVQPAALASKNRRAALRLERARAFGMLDRDRDAIGELRHAERLSPAQVRNNPLVRDMVVSILDRAQREAGGRDLRGLAWRMGIIRSA